MCEAGEAKGGENKFFHPTNLGPNLPYCIQINK